MTDGYGILRLSIHDESNRTVPARVSIRDSAGASFVPDSALPVFADCGKIPLDHWLPAADALQTIDFPQGYLLYDLAWREAHRQGGLAGYAHLGSRVHRMDWPYGS